MNLKGGGVQDTPPNALSQVAQGHKRDTHRANTDLGVDLCHTQNNHHCKESYSSPVPRSGLVEPWPFHNGNNRRIHMPFYILQPNSYIFAYRARGVNKNYVTEREQYYDLFDVLW